MSTRRQRDIHRHLFGNSRGRRARSSKANPQNHKLERNTTSYSHAVRGEVVKIDLHNHGIHQAKKRIKEECKYAEKNQTIQFCHGFNSGTQIRDFIRNGQLQQSLESLNIEGNIWAKDLGNTYFNRT